MNDQLTTARALGYGDDVRAMNREHDLVHLDLCSWLGVVSWSMTAAAGHELTPTQKALAEIEEEAALAVQRFIRAHRCGLPRDPPE